VQCLPLRMQMPAESSRDARSLAWSPSSVKAVRALRSAARSPLFCIAPIWGLLKKKTGACSSAAKDQGGQAARKLGHAVTRDSAVSSRQMSLKITQKESGHCQE
jgi:hypothetical protein